MLLTALFKHWSYRIFAPESMFHQSYEQFKALLEHDMACHSLMAEFEQLFHENRTEDLTRTIERYDRFSRAVSGMIEGLEQLSPIQASGLRDYFNKIDLYIRYLLAPPECFARPPFLVWNDQLPPPDQVGNKALHLMQLQVELGIRVPAGFTITSNGFNFFLEYNGLRKVIAEALAQLDIHDSEQLEEASWQLSNMILQAEVPAQLAGEIIAAYDALSEEQDLSVGVAVRSSAVHEDDEYSFAGQYRSVLGVERDGLLEAYRQVLASKYSAEALYYRISLGLADEETPLAVLVVAMVEARASGVIYTRNPIADQPGEQLLVHSVLGPCAPLVGGAAVPESFVVDTCGQVTADNRAVQPSARVEQPVSVADSQAADRQQGEPVISREQVRLLAEIGQRLDHYYGRPQDIEWAMRGDGTLFVLQCRALQVAGTSGPSSPCQAEPARPDPLLEAEVGSRGLTCGKVHILKQGSLATMPNNSVLVTRDTPASLVKIIHRLSGVVAEQGAVAGHFATVCREFGVPLLVGATGACTRLGNGQLVTVDSHWGAVYAGCHEQLLKPAQSTGLQRCGSHERRLKAVLGFITPLNLIDPESNDFQPPSCRSLHDIIRYCHEKGMQAMFALGSQVSGRSKHRRRLESDLPLTIYLLDAGGGFKADSSGRVSLPVDQCCCRPFRAIWQGLGHPGIDWASYSHFDWKGFDDIALAGGVAVKTSADFASYALISSDYLNLNLRFGYHFALVDALCAKETQASYCQLRFAGGGGDYRGRVLRIKFLALVLQKLAFEVQVQADLLDARVSHLGCGELCEKLDHLGRLLGATKLMDMVLKDEQDVERLVAAFFDGRYTFRSTV